MCELHYLCIIIRICNNVSIIMLSVVGVFAHAHCNSDCLMIYSGLGRLTLPDLLHCTSTAVH